MNRAAFTRLCYLLEHVGGLGDSRHVRVEEKGCLGALNGIYIDVHVPLCNKPRYRNQKGGISVNVLEIVDRILNFVYMLPSWRDQGSAADGRVLRDDITKPNGLKVPIGKFNKWGRSQLSLDIVGLVEDDVLIQALKHILVTGWKADNGIKCGYLNALADVMMKSFPGTDIRWISTTKMIEAEDEAWDKVNVNGAEGFADAMNGLLHSESKPENIMPTNLDDIPVYIPMVEEMETTSVCQPMGSDARLGDIVSKMGHDYDLTHKREVVFKLADGIDELTLQDKLTATNMIVTNTKVLEMFWTLPEHAQAEQVRMMLLGKL
ncbi:hypothetical protein BUALT_Bualt08G0047500 [Buddleja alternifolia]|uniref:Uncharacterized protein n=1 Tax=Buddleja alternifolia TaxID=168488 RepID=A0AAV6X346_9LAMI|nr:hypothetical protein BUALT_Bualt08G0047500 [Buddleja alternifolia]